MSSPMTPRELNRQLNQHVNPWLHNLVPSYQREYWHQSLSWESKVTAGIVCDTWIRQHFRFRREPQALDLIIRATPQPDSVKLVFEKRMWHRSWHLIAPDRHGLCSNVEVWLNQLFPSDWETFTAPQIVRLYLTVYYA